MEPYTVKTYARDPQLPYKKVVTSPDSAELPLKPEKSILGRRQREMGPPCVVNIVGA